MKLMINQENVPKFKEIKPALLEYKNIKLHKQLFENALLICKSIPKVEAIFLIGSIADGSADFFSDIDFYVMCNLNKEIKEIQDKILDKINELGSIIHVYRSNAKPNDVIIYFKPFIKFELVIQTGSDLSRKWKLAVSSKLLFDRNGYGQKILNDTKKLTFNIEDHINEVSNLALGIPSFCLIIAGYLIRGEFITSIDFLSWIRRKMLRISGFLLGIWDEGTRRAEQRFPKELVAYYNSLGIGLNEEMWENLRNILDWYANWMIPRFKSYGIINAESEVRVIREVIDFLEEKHKLG